MKKKYIQPEAEAYIVGNSAILESSVSVGDGYTSEQNAKQFNIDFSDDIDIFNENPFHTTTIE